MINIKLKTAVSLAMTGIALTVGSSDVFASTTMYNTFTTTASSSTDGWTHTGGSGNGGSVQPWVGTTGYQDTRPFNYIGSSHLNWAANLTSAGDSAVISSADSLSRYGFAAEIDTGGGAWRDNSAIPTGWRHQTDIGLIKSDVAQQVHINLTALGQQAPTFSQFGVTVFQGMDTNTGAYSHHGAWNNPAAGKLYTANNPFGTQGLTNIGFSDHVNGITDYSFTAQAGQIYSIYLGGVGFSKWNTGVDNYKLSLTTSPVPVPSAVWLFGSAIAGVMGFGRRKVASAV